MKLYCMDPGKHSCGVSVWDRRSGELLDAFLLKPAEGTPPPFGLAEALSLLLGNPEMRGLFAVEMPVQRAAYRRNIRRSDVAELRDVAQTCAYAAYKRKLGIVYLAPEAWKGSVRKDVHTRRVLGAAASDARLPRCRSSVQCTGQLTDREHERIQWVRAKRKNLDITDAIGIGLHVLGRWSTGKAAPPKV